MDFGFFRERRVRQFRPRVGHSVEPLEQRIALDGDTLTELDDITGLTRDTAEKPQSKVWFHDNTWWTVLPVGSGTWVWRLDGITWNQVLQLTTTKTFKADVKSLADVAHILLFDRHNSQLASIEYVAPTGGGPGTYQLWTGRPTLVDVDLDSDSETATLDIDSTGRLWIASDVDSTIEVRYADAVDGYSQISDPITLASDVHQDDIAAITALPSNQIGVIWSDQETERFGFRTHDDGAAPDSWSADEVPAGSVAINDGMGMADDHLNFAVASDGTVYVAVKTGYNNGTRIGMLVRRPNGVWDQALYHVASIGTRPILVLNEVENRVLVMYRAEGSGGPIVYRESSTVSILFGDEQELTQDGANDVTSTKQNFVNQLVVLATDGSRAKGVLLTTDTQIPNDPPLADVGGPYSGAEGSPIALDASATTDPDQSSGSLTYQWDIDYDGTLFNADFTGMSPSILLPDNFPARTIAVRVTDSQGAVSIATTTLTVTNAPPTAAIVGAPTESIESVPINLTSTVNDPGTADTFTYAWEVRREGSLILTGSNPTLDFTPITPGAYTVDLAVTDDDGDSGNAPTKSINVTDQPATATIVGAPANVAEGTPIALTSDISGTSGIVVYDWRVTRNGALHATGAAAEFNFTATDDGTYVVSLEIEDAADDSATAVPVTIDASNVVPTITASGAGNLNEGDTLVLTLSAPVDPGADTITQFIVDWGDGTTDVFATPGAKNHLYTDDNPSGTPADTYAVRVDLMDEDGLHSSAASHSVTVNNVPPAQAVITGAPASVAEGTLVSLGHTVVDPGAEDFTFAWSVTKDGSPFVTGSGSGLSFTPPDNGSYLVSLSISDDDGGSTAAPPVEISVTNVVPSVVINNAPAESNEGTPISVTSAVTDPGTADTFSYAWAVTKNGVPFATGDAPNLTFTPDDNGNYQVQLTVTDDDAAAGVAVPQTVTVTNVAPTASITGAPSSVPEGTAVTLNANIVEPGTADVLSYNWTVDKNGLPFASATTPQFQFTPDNNGNYVVNLTVSDDDGGSVAANSVSLFATNVSPAPTIQGIPTGSPEGTAVVLTAQPNDPGSLDTHSYDWSVSRSGTLVSTGNSQDFSFTPADDGPYTVALTVTDSDQASGTAPSATVQIVDVSPTISLTGNASVAEASTYSLVLGAITDPGTDTVTQYTVRWGDGASNTYSTPGTKTHVYLDDAPSGTPADLYNITVDLLDEHGLHAAAAMHTVQVVNQPPSSVVITGAPATSVEGATIQLSQQTADPSPRDTFTFAWTVNKNGSPFTTGTGNQFSFVPDDNGTYVIDLRATDDDTSFANASPVSIEVANVAPAASIGGAPSQSPEGTELFLSAVVNDPGSADTFTYAWEITRFNQPFATGTGSTISFTPDDDGIFQARLIVTDDEGASVTAPAKTIVATNATPTASIEGAEPNKPEGSPIELTASAFDPGNDTFTYEWTVEFDGNMVATSSDQELVFTPEENGTYQVTVTITDDDGGVGSDTLGILVAPANDPPSALAATTWTDEDVPLPITLTGDDGDAEIQQELTYALESLPTHGTLSGFNPDTGQVLYTPDLDFNGMDSFSFRVSDDDSAGSGGQTSQPATVTITVQPVNDIPLATPQEITIDEDSMLLVALSGEDGDAGVQQTLTFAIVTSPQHAALMGFDGATGLLSYLPVANYNGPDSLQFTVTDDFSAGGPGLTSAPQTVSLVIRPVNDTPLADAQSLQTDEDTPLPLVLTGADGDPEVAQTLQYTIVDQPQHGTLIDFDPQTGAATYVPDADYHGPDQFTFTMADDDTAGGDALTSAAATVEIEVRSVNDDPQANDDQLTVDEDGVDLPLDVLANDSSDPDQDETLTIVEFTPASHGTLSLEDGQLLYTPHVDYVGPDSFSYTISDEKGGTAEAQVQLLVAARDDEIFVTGAASGSPLVRVFSQQTGQQLASFLAYDAAFTGGVRVATGDINGDGTPDIITAPGPGGGPHVRVFDGMTGDPLPGPLGAGFFAYGGGFTGGVYVAVTDLNGDGLADIVTGAGAGGGPHVRVFSGADASEISGFFAYNPSFTGGVRPAAGDLNADGTPDIITAPGPGGGPHVRVFSGTDGSELSGFFAYDASFTGGLFVAAGDLDGDGHSDIITGAGAGGGPHVRAISGHDGSDLLSFFAYGAGFTGGVAVASSDLDGDGLADVITAAGPGGGPHVRGISGLDGSELAGFFAYDADFTGGVFVAGSPVTVPEQALRLSGSAGSDASNATPLTTVELNRLVAAAIAQWASVEIAPDTMSSLGRIDVRLANLPGDLLGISQRDAVLIDLDAAGAGWFIDSTPHDNTEFLQSADGLIANDPDATGRVDLLTVVLHELGHALGQEHSNEAHHAGIMSAALPTGIRRPMSPTIVDAVLSDD